MPIIDTTGPATVPEGLKHELADRLDTIFNEIAEEAGMNISYTESMDGSLFPEVVSLAMDEDADLGDLRFLAQNDRIFPKSLGHASLEEFREYIHAHEREVLAEVEAEAESDYYFRC